MIEYIKIAVGAIVASDVLNIFITSTISSGFVAGVLLIFRDFFSRKLTKTVEYRFERRLEQFKSDIRENEKDVEQIRDFLTLARRERDSALQKKRFEAAENMLRVRQQLSRLSMLVEYMKTFNIPEMMKSDDQERISEFLKALVLPLKIDENIYKIGEIERFNAELYLDHKTLQAFDCYQSIILHAAVTIKVLESPIKDKDSLLREGILAKKIINAVPMSKDGFDKYGEVFAFHWLEYFYEEILRSLRHELFGDASAIKDAEAVKRLALDTRQAQIDVHESLLQFGLPEKILNKAID